MARDVGRNGVGERMEGRRGEGEQEMKGRRWWGKGRGNENTGKEE